MTQLLRFTKFFQYLVKPNVIACLYVNNVSAIMKMARVWYIITPMWIFIQYYFNVCLCLIAMVCRY